ncbi:MAG TPA: myxococcus cysteine-rich repeat containing protein [Kofleriaceae bacterium]|jgi:cysteine-rich repeat protein|nr:myxococcus cysteine-rich repeat containing protein [Kofleriaceae bacterium]
MASARITPLLFAFLPLLAACPADPDGQLEPDAGTTSSPDASNPHPDAPPAPVCGDGQRGVNEACDDGNANSYDGCSAACAVEIDCACTGTPSTCTCTPSVTTTTQTITTTTQRVETASLALDNTNQPHVAWFYSINFTDPVTNYSREHAHAMYAEHNSSTSWGNAEIETWDQTQTTMSPKDFSLAYDGNALRAYYHRIYDSSGGTFETATRTSSSWSFASANPYYNYDVVRGGGNYHAIVGKTAFYDLHYMMGSPSGWTRDETLSGFSTSYPTRLAVPNSGDVYISSITPGTNHTSYNLKLSKRLNGFTWDTVYDVQTTGTCVYPISHNPLVLGNDLMLIEDGFSTGTGAQRWLKAHRLVNGTWTTETIADLSWYGYAPTCSTSGASYTQLPMVSAADANGNPHIVYASGPWSSSANNSMTIEDHYRDASGWHVRTYPLAKATPLDMKIDAQGTAHIVATTPSTTAGQTRVVYLRINATGWTSVP